MARLLVAQFDDFDSAAAAARDLQAVGVGAGNLETFALNAPGQHDRYPVGGDQDADRGARQGDEGAVAGAAIGGVAGLALGAAAIPVVGPLAAAAGAAVGAYTGAFQGAVGKLGDKPPQAEIPLRPAGVRLVANLAGVDREHAIAALHRHPVRSIEEAEGTWRDGHWTDFDPVSMPRWVEEPTQHKP
jgi:hypothetical protein